MPMAISVNIFRLRVTSDCQPRTKNGQPAHSTTGVANRNCSQFDHVWPSSMWRLVRWPPISSVRTGIVSRSPTQNRRVIAASSGFGAAPAEATSGSSAMPQIGQKPGPACLICGCIGQVEIVPSETEPFDPCAPAWTWAAEQQSLCVSTGLAPNRSAISLPRRSQLLTRSPRRRCGKLDHLLFDNRTSRIGRPECLVAVDVGQDLVVVPRAFRLFRTLYLHEQEIVHHQPVLSQTAVAREEIVHRP